LSLARTPLGSKHYAIIRRGHDPQLTECDFSKIKTEASKMGTIPGSGTKDLPDGLKQINDIMDVIRNEDHAWNVKALEKLGIHILFVNEFSEIPAILGRISQHDAIMTTVTTQDDMGGPHGYYNASHLSQGSSDDQQDIFRLDQ
jgi:hypothetical protein